MKAKIQSILIIALPLLFYYPNESMAQSETGIKGGINYSTIIAPNNNSNVEIERRDGIVLGGFYKKNNVLGPIGFQTELLYEQKGANYFIENIDLSQYPVEAFITPDNSPKSYFRSNEKLHYLTLPLLLNVNATNFLDIYAGPELSYLLSQKTNREETDELNQFSAGVVMGATLRLCENTKLDFRYSSDFTSFDKLGKNSDVDMRNRSFTITIQQTIFINQNK
jgi:hypothetical protein